MVNRLHSDDDILSEVRGKINATDREIVRLLLGRAELAAEVGRLKHRSGTAVYRPDREKDIYRNIVNYANEMYDGNPPLNGQILENIYREIMSGSIAIEGGPTVAYLGPPASFSHLAVRGRFGSSLTELPLDSIQAVFRAVESREATYGIVPVDNSSGGSVGPTHDMLLKSDLKIYAEQYIRVNQNLLATEELELRQIKKLYTLRIVYEQCRDWIHSHLSLDEDGVQEVSSTTAAVQMVLKNRDGAALASELAAQMYDLKVVARNVQDSSNNITRFLIIGNEQCPPSGDDKTSIICSLKDRPGSLFELLEPFHKRNINLARIESVITRKAYGDYNFYIDFFGHSGDAKVAEVLQLLAERTTMLKLMGSYPRANLP